MIGVSIGDIVTTFQLEGAKVLKKTNGDVFQIITYVLNMLETRKVLSPEDRKVVADCFHDALAVLAGKKKASRVLVSLKRRHTSLISSPASSDVSRALAEYCYTVISDNETANRRAATEATSVTIVSNAAEKALLWGAIGAGIGGSIGGGLGAVLGGAIGAALGACGDNDTALIVTTPGGGGSPA